MFIQYMYSKIKTIIAFIIAIGMFTVIAKLYGLPWGGCIYAVLLCLFFAIIITIYGFYRYAGKANYLEDQKMKAAYLPADMPKAVDKIEEEYQEIIGVLTNRIAELTSKRDSDTTEMIDYYTMWVHQIKTPIAAMGLLLQTESFEGKPEMQMELFKIQQYVEMVLQYLRLGSEQTDFVFRKLDLDTIIKDCVKKYSASFIRKKISLEYRPVNAKVLTDEKWLSFVIEQVLSNALKYTSSGKIAIYMDEDNNNTLVVEDTGIGIQAEDLPRVFDRGYTGYNGRTDKKSTGIGLYLCNSIIKKLGHSMTMESEVGVGTKVKIDLSYRDVVYE